MGTGLGALPGADWLALKLFVESVKSLRSKVSGVLVKGP